MHFKHSWQSVFAKAESHSKRVHKATKLEAYFSHKLPESRSQVSICIRPLPLLCRESCGEKNCHKVTHYVNYDNFGVDLSLLLPLLLMSTNLHTIHNTSFLEKNQKMNNQIYLKKLIEMKLLGVLLPELSKTF